jgi:hypothetical protein
MDHEEMRFTCALIAVSLPVCLLASEESRRGSETLSALPSEADDGLTRQRESRTRPAGFVESLPRSIMRLRRWGLRTCCRLTT